MIDAHALLEPVVRPRRLGIRRLVHGRIADQVVHGPRALERLEVLHEVPHRLEASQFELHDHVGVVGHAHLLRDALALFDVADGHDDEVPSGFGQGDGAVESEAGGGAGDDGELALADFDATQHLGGFLVLGEVELLGELGLGEHFREEGGGGDRCGYHLVGRGESLRADLGGGGGERLRRNGQEGRSGGKGDEADHSAIELQFAMRLRSLQQAADEEEKNESMFGERASIYRSRSWLHHHQEIRDPSGTSLQQNTSDGGKECYPFRHSPRSETSTAKQANEERSHRRKMLPPSIDSSI